MPGAKSLRPPAYAGRTVLFYATSHSSPWTHTYPSWNPPNYRCCQNHWPYAGEWLHRPGAYKEDLKTIHTNVVSNHLASRPTNRVLQCPAPDIFASETVLPRRHRTTLAQLRSGQCSRLLTYKHVIGLSPTDVCPECNSEAQTTSHLFRCIAQPPHFQSPLTGRSVGEPNPSGTTP